MADPIAAMLGLDIDDEAKTRALADSLRGRKRAADFFAASTVDPIAAGAQAEAADVMSAAEKAGGLRKALAERKHQKMMQQDRQDFTTSRYDIERGDQVADRDELRGYNEQQADDERYREEMAADYQTLVNPETNERMRARWQDGELIDDRGMPVRNTHGFFPEDEIEDIVGGTAGGGAGTYNRIGGGEYGSVGERNAHTEAGEKAEQMGGLFNSYSDWKPMAPGVGVAQDIEGWLVKSGYAGSEEEQAQYTWWADYKKYIENPERNDMFGATLTDNELATWNKSSINESMDPSYVRGRLEVQNEIAQSTAEKMAVDALELGATVTQVRNKFPSVDVLRVVDELESGAYFDNREKRFKLFERKLDDIQTAADKGEEYNPINFMTSEQLDHYIATGEMP